MSRAARRFRFLLTVLGCFGGGSLYGWSGYLPAVRVEFDVGNAAASMVFSLVLVSFTFGVLIGPILLAKIQPRLRLPFVAGLAALSLVVSGASTSFAGFAIAYGTLFGFASGALYNHAISVASASDAAILLVPVSVAAFGLGGAVFGPVNVWLTATGWGLWSMMPAMVSLAGTAVAALALKVPPEAPVAQPLAPIPFVKPDKTIAILWIIFATGSCSGLIVLGFAAQFLPAAEGGIGLISLAIFLAALGNGLGRLSSALTASWFGPARGISLALMLSLISLTCLLGATAPGLLVGLLFMVAFAYGQLAATMPLLVKSQVKDAAFSGSFGWVFTGWGVAGLLGPWGAGGLFDATGSLKVPIVVCILLLGLSFWLVLPFAKQGQDTETR